MDCIVTIPLAGDSAPTRPLRYNGAHARKHESAANHAMSDASDFDAAEAALRVLVSGIAGGDEADLARLYDATAGRVYAAALRLTNDRGAAEEVASDTYWQVWREAGRYDPLRGRVIAWLLIICRSRALDHIRRREPALTAADPHAFAGADGEVGMSNEPLAAFFTGQRAGALCVALQCLNATEQKLIGLAFFRGLSHQEIAGETSMPLGTVKTVIRRALQTLRGAINLPAIAEEEPS